MASCLTQTLISLTLSVVSVLTFYPGQVGGDQAEALVRHDAETTCHVSTEAIPGVTSGN